MPFYYQYQRSYRNNKWRIKTKTRPVFIILLSIAFSLLLFSKINESSTRILINSSLAGNTSNPAMVNKAGFGNILEISEGGVPSPVNEYKTPKIFLEGEISRGGSIYACLSGAGVSHNNIKIITSELKDLFDFNTQTRPGDTYSLTLTQEGKIEKFKYQRSPLEIYYLTRLKDDRWKAWRNNIKLVKYWVKMEGEINGSLFSTFQREGHPASLAVKFAEIFEWKIDFQHEVREGDRFSFIVERLFRGQEPIDYGRIVAAMYDGKATGELKGFYFEQEEGRGDYFCPDGTSLKRAFLRSPLSYKYISAGFSYRRKHPILGSVKPHLGIDFAAPYGSPVWAVADGTVISKSYDRYNGSQIILRHSNSYITYYNHLSRFTKGMRRGDRVKQKQIIGYVGTSGLSTGPHLDYRVKKNGKFINPLRTKYPSGKSLKKEYMPKFQMLIADLESLLNGKSTLAMNPGESAADSS